jgi:hypothetical protein
VHAVLRLELEQEAAHERRVPRDRLPLRLVHGGRAALDLEDPLLKEQLTTRLQSLTTRAWPLDRAARRQAHSPTSVDGVGDLTLASGCGPSRRRRDQAPTQGPGGRARRVQGGLLLGTPGTSAPIRATLRPAATVAPAPPLAPRRRLRFAPAARRSMIARCSRRSSAARRSSSRSAPSTATATSLTSERCRRLERSHPRRKVNWRAHVSVARAGAQHSVG